MYGEEILPCAPEESYMMPEPSYHFSDYLTTDPFLSAYSSAYPTNVPSASETPLQSEYEAPLRVERTSPSTSPRKLFKCPHDGCNKVYKNSNGLKYHLTQGNCDATADASQVKMRRFFCRVCGRKYKNLNGLKYHTKEHPDMSFEAIKGVADTSWMCRIWGWDEVRVRWEGCLYFACQCHSIKMYLIL